MFDPEMSAKLRGYSFTVIKAFEALVGSIQLPSEIKRKRISKLRDLLESARGGFIYYDQGIVPRDFAQKIDSANLLSEIFQSSPNLRGYTQGDRAGKLSAHIIELESDKVPETTLNFLQNLMKATGQYSRSYSNREDSDDYPA